MKKKQSLASVLRKSQMIPGADAIPLFGNAPPFDWHQLSSLLATRFEMKDFSVHPSNQAWATYDEVKEQLGSGYFSTPIFLNPLQPPFFFAIPKADKNKLTAALMDGKAKSQISEPLKEGFCRFIVLETLAAASSIEPIAKLSPTLGEEEEIPDENAFCIDVEISFGDISCWSKLIIPASFRKAWMEHFAMHKPEYVTTELSKATELIIDCECGSTLLTQAEWDGLEAGDFILLDHGNFDAESKSAIVLLKAGTATLFQAKITENQMELLDYAFTSEDDMEKESDLPAAEEESISMKELPLTVCVELARLRITLDKLMHLTPGNTLTLPVHPDQGVDLTVNGKKVGRAELLYLGESLGIRILELG